MWCQWVSSYFCWTFKVCSMKWSIFNLGFHLAVWTLEAFGDCSRAYIQHVVQNFYYALTFNFFIQVIIKLKQDGPSEDSYSTCDLGTLVLWYFIPSSNFSLSYLLPPTPTPSNSSSLLQTTTPTISHLLLNNLLPTLPPKSSQN